MRYSFRSPLFFRYATGVDICDYCRGPHSYPDEMYLSIRSVSNFATSKWSMLLSREVYFLAACTCARIPQRRSHHSLDWLNFFKFLRNFHFRAPASPPSPPLPLSAEVALLSRFAPLTFGSAFYRNSDKSIVMSNVNDKQPESKQESQIFLSKDLNKNRFKSRSAPDREMCFAFVRNSRRINNVAHIRHWSDIILNSSSNHFSISRLKFVNKISRDGLVKKRIIFFFNEKSC